MAASLALRSCTGCPSYGGDGEGHRDTIGRCSPAAVYRYRLATGVNRWFFIIDLPTDADGRHRQHKRRGFPSHATAVQAEQHARAPAAAPSLADWFAVNHSCWSR